MLLSKIKGLSKNWYDIYSLNFVVTMFKVIFIVTIVSSLENLLID